MADECAGKKTTRKRMTARERRKVLDIHIEEPELSVRKIASRTRMKPSTVHRILSLFKDGKIDRDGFQYESPLWP